MTRTLEELGVTPISDLLDRRLSIFAPKDTISKVLGELDRTGRYEAVVCSGSKMGLLTIRDILDVEQPDKMKVERLWKPLTPVSSDSRVSSVATEMVRINTRALPVVEGTKPVGIISQVDIIGALTDCTEIRTWKAKDLAKMPTVTINISEKISKARKLMLERGFSHIPILRAGKLVGIVTAQDIVHTYIAPSEKITLGERTGSKVNRFSGSVFGIMDAQPLTVEPDATALDVVRGIVNRSKSACLIADQYGAIHGIITPRELLPLIAKPVDEAELPVYIVGLTDEDFFERGVAEEKLRRLVTRNMRIYPGINEVSIKIKRKHSKGGERTRYEVTARIISPFEQFNATTQGWDLLATFDDLLENLDSTLKRAKREPLKTARRGHGRS